MPRKKKRDPIVETVELTEKELHEIRSGVKLREEDLERARDYLVKKDLATAEVDELLLVIRGDGPTRPGLKAKLGFRDEVDPDQTDLDGELEGDGDGGADGGKVAGEISH